MKAPQFWQRKSFISYILLPLTFLYRVAGKLHYLFVKPKKISMPVICVGNVVAGGSGKTPIAIEIGEMLKEMNCDFAYLSRGYGGSINKFTLVDRKYHKATEVGDEPLLLAETFSTYIASDRVLAAEKIAAMKKLIIMDDGLQNTSIIKDFVILVIDGVYGFGNGMIIPAGPLRENISSGIEKANLIIIIGEDKFNIAGLYKDKKIIFAKIRTVGEQFKNIKTIAFCGIGRPTKFFTSLKENRANVMRAISYPDHYFFKESDIKYLQSLANKHHAQLVTTKKDWVRLDKKYQNQVKYLDIKIEFDDPDYLKNQLAKLNEKIFASN